MPVGNRPTSIEVSSRGTYLVDSTVDREPMEILPARRRTGCGNGLRLWAEVTALGVAAVQRQRRERPRGDELHGPRAYVAAVSAQRHKVGTRVALGGGGWC